MGRLIGVCILAGLVLLSGCASSDLILEDKGKFSYSVEGCAVSGMKSETFALPITQDRGVSIQAWKDSIEAVHIVNHACCLELEVTSEQAENSLFVREKFSGSACKCICQSTVTATFKNLEQGEYTIRIFVEEAGIEKLDYESTVRVG